MLTGHNQRSLGVYTVNVTIGTPPQQLALQLDTGSSDIVIPARDFCDEAGDTAGTTCSAGSYSAADSSTYESYPGTLNASYGDKSAVLGDYAIDTLSLGDLDVGNVIFGIGNNMSSTFNGGILGIGYVLGESVVGQQQNISEAYPNLPILLARRGIIQSAAYSLWLNEQGSDEGTILFGGIDTEKYEGELITVPVVPSVLGFYNDLRIALTNVSFGGQTATLGNATDPMPATLDSGSAGTILPFDVVRFLYDKLNVDNTTDGAFVDCGLRDSDKQITYTFSEASINVSLSRVVLGPEDPDERCTLGIVPLLPNLPDIILGETFLTSAYVVYNLEKNQISLAQARYGSDASNIVAIGSGDATLPEAASSGNAIVNTQAGAGPALSLVLAVSVCLALV